MDKRILINKMNAYISVKEQLLSEKEIEVKSMTFTNLRDSIIGLGTIVEEDFELNVYIVNIPAGVLNQNSAIIAIQLCDNKLLLLGYAKEGLIKQHTAERAINRIIEKLSSYY